MNKFKSLKNIIVKTAAIVISSIVIAECLPVPMFEKTVKAASGTNVYYGYDDGFEVPVMNLGNVTTGEQLTVTVSTSEANIMGYLSVEVDDYVVDMVTTDTGDYIFTFFTNTVDLGEYTSRITFFDAGSQVEMGGSAEFTVNYTIVEKVYTDSFSLNSTSLSYGQKIGYKYDTNRENVTVSILVKNLDAGTSQTFNQAGLASYIPEPGKYSVKATVNGADGANVWESNEIACTVGKAEAKLALQSNSVNEGEKTGATVSYFDPSTGGTVVMNASDYVLKYSKDGAETTTFPSTSGQYTVKAYFNSDSLKLKYTEPTATLQVVSKETASTETTETNEKTIEEITDKDTTKDTTKPKITGVKNNETIYKDSVKVEITDENLKEVTVNGEKQNIANNKCVLNLESNGNKEKYVIVATDASKNKITTEVTIAAPWTETGVIPADTKVKLYKGNKITFGSGKWKIAGDPTIYNGGIDIYIPNDMEIVATKVD